MVKRSVKANKTIPKGKTPKSKSLDYRLSLSEGSCRVLMKALDLYYRIGMGQIDEITRVAVPAPGHKADPEWVARNRHVLKDSLLGWRFAGTSHSIRSPELPDEMRVASDIHDVIRHHLAVGDARRNGTRGFGVAFDEVVRRGDEPLPTIGGSNESIR